MIDTALRAVIAVCLLFLSYVAYGFHVDRNKMLQAADSAAVMSEHCRLMKATGKTSDECW